ncbi:hypothetical protein Q0590_26415 [Rhodocytophaga aerolata]|uniref:P-type conjugative transfer protein TrbJ n=1 Tax=Rhodocytophaga aerolata TaxID=455078 RepID=A0ABT8RCL0_9BACT|nr:hypothetical protein [Rhodocytophaga aerolata]MDO1449841.1 hypothetical protein [Rhodocytophaga aerolata]
MKSESFSKVATTSIRTRSVRIKKVLTSMLLGLLILSSPLVQAQMLVYDPMQFSNMVQSIAQQAKQVLNSAKMLSETKNILTQAVRTKEELQNLHQLTRKAHEALKVARGIVDLKWSDLDPLTKKALDLPVDPHRYLPDSPLKQTLREALQKDPTARSAQELYTLLSAITSYSDLSGSYADFISQQQGSLLSQFSLQEMADQKSLQAALSYNQLSEQMISQAHELMTAVKTDFKLTMNDSERLTSLKQCQDLLLQSLELKLKADQLLQASGSKSGSAKHTLQQAYKNALFRRSLAQTPQVKYGQ